MKYFLYVYNIKLINHINSIEIMKTIQRFKVAGWKVDEIFAPEIVTKQEYKELTKGADEYHGHEDQLRAYDAKKILCVSDGDCIGVIVWK